MNSHDEDYVSSQEALFMLDTDMEQDLQSNADELTGLTIRHINSTPELYDLVKDNKTVANVSSICYGWAEANNNEFGQLFQTELDEVKWSEVVKRI